MLDSRFGAHIKHLTSQLEAPKAYKMLLSAERSPLCDGSGSTTRTFKGPPCNAENELSLWPLNRLACGHRASFQIGNFWICFAHLFCLKPLFLFCSDVHIQCSNIGPKLCKKTLTLRNQFEEKAGRFAATELAF